MFGSRVVPDEDAERITERERAEQGIQHESPEGAPQQSPRQTPQQRPGDIIPEAARLKDPRLGWYSPSLTQARSDGRKTGAVDKTLYYVILAAQFIPSLRSVHASKTKRA
jgi:hypothetical protein